eukprot:5442612-Amphidinium_carterae.1
MVPGDPPPKGQIATVEALQGHCTLSETQGSSPAAPARAPASNRSASMNISAAGALDRAWLTSPTSDMGHMTPNNVNFLSAAQLKEELNQLEGIINGA